MKILLIAIILRLLSNPTANVLQKKLMQNYGSFVVNTITYFGLSIGVIPLILNTDFLMFPRSVWVFGVIGGFLGALGNAFLVKALSLGDLSVLGPINAYKAVVSMIFGVFLLNEYPSSLGIAAVALIILGSYFIFDSVEEKFSLRIFLRKDIQYRIVALILTAAEAVFIKKVIVLSSVVVSFIFWCVFGFVFSFAFALLRKEKVKQISVSTSLMFFGLILMFGIMQYSTNYVFDNMNTAYALALFQLSSVIAVFFGYKFFKENHILKKLTGTVIMVVGAIIIILC